MSNNKFFNKGIKYFSCMTGLVLCKDPTSGNPLEQRVIRHIVQVGVMEFTKVDKIKLTWNKMELKIRKAKNLYMLKQAGMVGLSVIHQGIIEVMSHHTIHSPKAGDSTKVLIIDVVRKFLLPKHNHTRGYLLQKGASTS